MEEEGEADDEGALVFLAKEQQSLDHLLAKLHILGVKMAKKALAVQKIRCRSSKVALRACENEAGTPRQPSSALAFRSIVLLGGRGLMTEIQ